MPDYLIQKANEIKNEMSKELGKVNDQKRAREQMYEIDTRTKQGRKDMLDLARKEISMFNRSEHFEKMIGTLDMTYDQFVDHEMKNLNGKTAEGREQLATMAGIERREYGETERFRQMLDKGGITPQAFEYFDKNGELPGMKNRDVSFKGSAERNRGEETHNPREVKKAQDAQEKMAERRETQEKEMDREKAQQEIKRRENTLREAHSAMKRGDAGEVRKILAESGLRQSDLMNYSRAIDGGEVRRDSFSPSFGMSNDERIKINQAVNAAKDGNKIATENRLKELKALQEKEAKKAEAKKDQKKN